MQGNPENHFGENARGLKNFMTIIIIIIIIIILHRNFNRYYY